MLTNLERAEVQWGGSHSVIDKWLEERKDMLSKYCKLSGLPPFKKQTLPTPEQVRSFCNILVDYISAGHFEIYERIVQECETHGEDSLALARQLYPKISETTELFLEFNDKYSLAEGDESFENLDKHLSKLGEMLSHRIELEDKLIETLYEKHI